MAAGRAGAAGSGRRLARTTAKVPESLRTSICRSLISVASRVAVNMREPTVCSLEGALACTCTRHGAVSCCQTLCGDTHAVCALSLLTVTATK